MHRQDPIKEQRVCRLISLNFDQYDSHLPKASTHPRALHPNQLAFHPTHILPTNGSLH
ncbi:unnamed protein product [Mycena citricolor]|uniref:Uncharacterized protein n=1 Tax=Mycena citricolor TaxID=2018698 RepID=A0AAD2HBH3_9AGAR|nr:unnamed protein product [Mycena citricolor]